MTFQATGRISRTYFLRVYLSDGAKAVDAANFLTDMNSVYCHLLAFRRLTDTLRSAQKVSVDHLSYLSLADKAVEQAENKILGDTSPLYLNSANLSTPGWLEFFGALNPLETLRKYLDDRHRRKIVNSLSDLDRRRFELENESLENKVIAEKLAILSTIDNLLHQLYGPP